MGKTVFMFPGQGSQYFGMGKEFYEELTICREVFDLASQVSGLDLKTICFEENDMLNVTEYTQVAMLATEVAILKALEEKGYKPDAAAGLSLGEYGALVASGAITMENAFSLIRKRGIYMQEAVPEGGAMSAILGLANDKIEAACEATEGIVSVANYNCPGQAVITGESFAVEAAGEKCKEAGAKRVVALKVSGPFHSAMLSGAGQKLKDALDEIDIAESFIPYVSNVTADYVTDAGSVKELLTMQVSSPVRWQQSIEMLLSEGYDTFIEIGPGKTLSGFMKKITKETGHTVEVYNIDKMEDFLNYVN
ncbi:MAG: ACP S-malonyltransferase [Lachnospiraceae bacterium]